MSVVTVMARVSMTVRGMSMMAVMAGMPMSRMTVSGMTMMPMVTRMAVGFMPLLGLPVFGAGDATKANEEAGGDQ